MEGRDGEGVEAGGEMHSRRVTLADGRYLIFYTFGDDRGESRPPGERAGEHTAPAAGPAAEEERGV